MKLTDPRTAHWYKCICIVPYYYSVYWNATYSTRSYEKFQFYLPQNTSYTWFYSPAAQYRHLFICRPAHGWSRWGNMNVGYVPRQIVSHRHFDLEDTVTHPTTNRARRMTNVLTEIQRCARPPPIVSEPQCILLEYLYIYIFFIGWDSVKNWTSITTVST